MSEKCPKCGSEIDERATFNGVTVFSCGSTKQIVLGKERFSPTPFCEKDCRIAKLEKEVERMREENAELQEDYIPKHEGIYVASKTKHAAIWRHYRDQGFPIISTWIDEAGEGESASYEELATRCIEESKAAEVMFLFCEDDEILKGALIEVGAALASGVPVYCAGTCPSLSRVFCKHPLWNEAANPAAFFYSMRHFRRASALLKGETDMKHASPHTPPRLLLLPPSSGGISKALEY